VKLELQSEFNNKNYTNRHLIVLLSIIFVEFVLFRTYLAREINWNYPTFSDQAGYLKLSYQLLELILNQDYRNIINLLKTLPQGILFPLQGALYFLFTGASRSNALTINFIYFGLTQIVVFLLVNSFAKKISISYFCVGLLLLVPTTFFWAGGITDYRIDFLAFCVYLIYLCVVIKSEMFLSKKWSSIVMIIACSLVLFRFIALTYILATLIILFIIFLIILLLTKSEVEKAKSKTRLMNMILNGGLIGIVLMFVFYLNRKALYGYYFVGHLLGDEKEMRAREVGITDIWGHLTYYPISLIKDHLGILAVLVLVIIILLILLRTINNTRYKATYNMDSMLNNIFLFLSFFIPLVILTLNISKSPVVANILVGPIILFATFGIFYLSKEHKYRKFVICLSAMVFCVGIANFVLQTSSHTPNYINKNDSKVLNQMYQDIGDYIISNKIKEPILSVDQVVDYLSSDILQDIYYEKTGIFISAKSGLGSSFAVGDDTKYLQVIKQSDVVIFNNGVYPNEASSAYPFNNHISKLKPELLRYLDSEMLLLDNYRFFDQQFNVYVKPKIRLSGNSGSWLLAKGAQIEVPKEILDKTPVIFMSGARNSYVKNPSPYAQTVDGKSITAKTILDEKNYFIYFFLPEHYQEGSLKFNVNFKDYFIPEKIGLNNDTRELAQEMPSILQPIISRTDLTFPNDSGLLHGVYSDGWVGNDGFSTELIMPAKSSSSVLKLNISVPEILMSAELHVDISFLDSDTVIRKNLVVGENNLVIDIPKDVINSRFIGITVKPSFSFVPGIEDKRELSFQFKKISVGD
jgi:hypothetical protein